MTATDKTLDLQGKHILSGMVVTYQLCKQLRASPTMEAQVAGRVMADMFDDGSIFLASFVLLNMVQHSGISKHELRLPGVQS